MKQSTALSTLSYEIKKVLSAELSHNKPYNISHAEDITKQVEALSRKDHSWGAGRL